MVRLDAFVKERNSLAIRYKELLHDLPVHLTQVKQENISAYHLYPVCLTGEAAVSNHKKTFDCLRDQGVGVNLHYMPVHLQPYYRAMGFKEGMFPEAEKYASVSISLPLYVGLTEDEQIYVAHAVAKAIA